MSQEIKVLCGKRIQNYLLKKYLQNQINLLEKENKEHFQEFFEKLSAEVNASLPKISSGFEDYLSKTVASYSTLSQCFYYQTRSNLDRISINDHLLDVLESVTTSGRAYIVLPAHRLPKKAFMNFFKNLGIDIEEMESSLTMFLQQIPKVENDPKKYVCFGFHC